jgi:3-deoxy-manno-octulosonate cytidylyltransferase (CMP-KDO synthetase)
MKTIGIIPARLQSTRLPRKLLLDETGQPLLQYVWEAAKKADSLSEVIVATDSEGIADCVRNFGGRVELTGDHPSGSDRVAEVVRKCCGDAEIVVNLQGDEPELQPASVDLLVQTLIDSPGSEMATLATPLWSAEEVRDPGNVKAVLAADGRALYFSRSPIPYVRDQSPEEYFANANSSGTIEGEETRPPWLLHLGIYGYRRDFLLELTAQPPSRLEELEKLEQLRALEAGATIQVAIIDHRSVGIDTPEDYARFVKRQQQNAA